jgi:glycosyltransferase involved in cell wall biosynthesis
MRILQLLTYYRPNLSGLTIYVERLSRGLVEAGHQVSVLTSQFEPTLPQREMIEGVQVVRVPVALRINKGVIMPSYGATLRRMLPDFDVLHLHLPQFDGAGIALNARLGRKPALLTAHGDIRLPDLPFNSVVQRVINTMNRIAGANVDRVVSYTEDFAAHSHFFRRYPHKLSIVPPPIEMQMPRAEDIAAFRAKWQIDGHPLIGMVARLAAEKGVEILARALEVVLAQAPQARVMFVGPYENVLGERDYGDRMQALITQLTAKHGHCWDFVGPLRGAELAAFFACCDVHVLPSLNSTEAFGLVQVEAMLCGTPIICSDLPGVRTAPRSAQMGEVVPIGDAAGLAAAILEITNNRARYVKSRAFIENLYSTQRTVREYEQIYRDLIRARAA